MTRAADASKFIRPAVLAGPGGADGAGGRSDTADISLPSRRRGGEKLKKKIHKTAFAADAVRTLGAPYPPRHAKAHE